MTSPEEFLDALAGFSSLHAVKLYRLSTKDPLALPAIPCLDHEAVLHENVAPHAAAYIQDRSGSFHEVVFIPDERRIVVDVVSTMGECDDEAHRRLVDELRTRFPGQAIKITGPSWIKGDRRVAAACRAQVTLREVLTGDELDRTRVKIDRLQTISSLMEKESRVASWGARTIMTPMLAVTGFLIYEIAGTFAPEVGDEWVSLIRYVAIGAIGSVLLYYGIKAVHLTLMDNRVWKRAAEYGLILNERRRLGR
jgi:hypothetical protein